MSDAPDAAATEDAVEDTADEATPDEEVIELSELEAWTSQLAQELDAIGWVVDFDTPRIHVEADRWVETILAANTTLPFFSWLSAIDWSREVEVGEAVADPDDLEERFEVICRLSSVETSDGATFVATLPKDNAVIGSLAPHIGGAAWHEREAHEMFGIDFDGNPDLSHLYLPDDFVGNPLLKSFPLLSREVKPWPGTVDVEDMPATDEEEAT